MNGKTARLLKRLSISSKYYREMKKNWNLLPWKARDKTRKRLQQQLQERKEVKHVSETYTHRIQREGI